MLLNSADREYIMHPVIDGFSISLLVWGLASFGASSYLVLKRKPLPDYRRIVFRSFIFVLPALAGVYFLNPDGFQQLHHILSGSSQTTKGGALLNFLAHLIQLIFVFFVFHWVIWERGDYFLIYPYVYLVDVVRRDTEKEAERVLDELTRLEGVRAGLNKGVIFAYVFTILAFFVWEIFLRQR